MSRSEALLCLAGAEVMPNAIAARQLGVERLLILHSDEEFSRLPAERLESWWEASGGTAVLKRAASPMDLTALQTELRRWLSAKYRWRMNVTGGTKPMSLAAVAVALEREAPICYVDTAGGRLLWLQGEPAEEPLTADFTVEEIFALHGHRPDPPPRALSPQRIRLAQALAADRLALHALARVARDGTWRPGCRVELSDAVWREPLTELSRQGLGLELLQGEPTYAVELSEEAFRQVRGDWLELLAADAIRRAGAAEAFQNVCVPYRESAGVKNETDAVGVIGGRLVVLECKAGAGLNKAMLGSLASHARSLGGAMAVPMMVYSPPNEEPRSQFEQRREQAAEQGVLFHFGHDPEAIAAAIRTALELR